MAITIKEAVTVKEKKLFMDFANKLYKDEPNFIPSIFFDEMNSIDPKKNLSFEFSDTILLLAYNDNKLVGRVRGLVNYKYNDKNDHQHLRFNHFDVLDNYEITEALLDYLVAWGKAKGMTHLNGPIGYNDLDKQGLLIEGFEYPGMFITYYNFPYYQEHLERYGLEKDVDWVEYRVQVPKEVNPRIKKIQQRVIDRSDFEVKKLHSKKQLRPYLYKIFHTYNEAFAPLHGVTELTDAQIDQYVKQYLPLMNLKFLSVLVDKNDDVAAFGLLGPSLNSSLVKNRGRLFPFGWISLLKAIKNPTVLDMYLVAVKPELQGLGLNSILMGEITNNAIENNIEYAETGPELEDNAKIRSFWKNYDAEQVRRRRCFIKEI